MTHEERANYIRTTIVAVLMAIIGATAWFLPDLLGKPSTELQPQRLLVIFYHLPGNPDSEALSSTLALIEPRYAAVVEIQRVDVIKERDKAVAAAVTKVPHVAIFNGPTEVGSFTGRLAQPKVETKLDEILRGLKRVSKDWRPTVAGMSASQ